MLFSWLKNTRINLKCKASSGMYINYINNVLFMNGRVVHATHAPNLESFKILLVTSKLPPKALHHFHALTEYATTCVQSMPSCSASAQIVNNKTRKSSGITVKKSEEKIIINS